MPRVQSYKANAIHSREEGDQAMPKRTMKEIKRIGADLKPTIHVGKDGITDSLIEEVKLQVKTRKVVKIRIAARFRR